MTVAELHVLLEAKDKQFKQALADAEKGLERVEGKADRTAKNVSEAWGRAGKTMKEVGTLFTATFTTAGIAIAGFAVKASSDLNESVSKAKQVFGEATAQIDAFAKTSAEGLGIARQEALDMASAMGLVLQASGKTEKQAAEMSVTLSRLAGDMSSFFNVSISEAAASLQSGLVGEAEPLRRFGVLLSETAVKAKAMEMGLGAVGRELTEGEKVQARYSIILEQTTKAQGDFSRTSDGLANQQRTLTAQIKEIATEIGDRLLPVVLQITKAVREAAQWFLDLDDATKGVLLTFAGALAVLGPVLLVLGQLAQGISAIIALNTAYVTAMAAKAAATQGLGASAVAATAAVSGLTVAFGALAGAVGVLGAAWLTVKQAQRQAEGMANMVAQRAQGAAVASGLDRLAASKRLGLKDPSELDGYVAKHGLGALPSQIQQLVKGVNAAKDQLAKVNTANFMDEFSASLTGLSDTGFGLGGTGLYGGAAKGGRGSGGGGGKRAAAIKEQGNVFTRIASEAAQQIGEATQRVNQEIADLEWTLTNSMNKKLAAAEDPSGSRLANFLGIDHAQLQSLTPAFRKTMIQMRMQIALFSGDLQKLGLQVQSEALQLIFGGGSRAARGAEANMAYFQGVAAQVGSVAYQLMQATKRAQELTAASAAVSQSFAAEQFAAQIRAFEEDVQFAKDQAELWADTILDGLDRVRTEGFAGLLRSFEDTLWQMGQAALRSELTRMLTGLFRSPSLTEQVAGQASNIAGLFRAEGGPVTSGQPYIVGERGPEWFVPKASGTVLPNGAGGGVTVNITVNGIRDEGSLGKTAGQIARQAAAAVEAAKRRG